MQELGLPLLSIENENGTLMMKQCQNTSLNCALGTASSFEQWPAMPAVRRENLQHRETQSRIMKTVILLALQQNTLIRHTYVIAQIHTQWPFWCKRANTTRKCTLQPDFTLPNGDVTIVSHTAVSSHEVHWNYPGCDCYCPQYCISQHCHSFCSKDKAWHGKRQIMGTENHQKVAKTEAHESASWNVL